MMKSFCEKKMSVKSCYFSKKVLPEIFEWFLKTPPGIVRAAFLARSFCKAYTANDVLSAPAASLKTKAFGWVLVWIGRLIGLGR